MSAEPPAYVPIYCARVVERESYGLRWHPRGPRLGQVYAVRDGDGYRCGGCGKPVRLAPPLPKPIRHGRARART